MSALVLNPKRAQFAWRSLRKLGALPDADLLMLMLMLGWAGLGNCSPKVQIEAAKGMNRALAQPALAAKLEGSQGDPQRDHRLWVTLVDSDPRWGPSNHPTAPALNLDHGSQCGGVAGALVGPVQSAAVRHRPRAARMP